MRGLSSPSYFIYDEYSNRGHPTYCQFYDVEKLSTFADYRIPQLFHSLHVLEYAPALHQKIASQEMLWSGCSEEIYIYVLRRL